MLDIKPIGAELIVAIDTDQMPKRSPVEKVLHDLQRAMRRRLRVDEQLVSFRAVPPELAEDKELRLAGSQEIALQLAIRTVASDLAFEHLGDTTKDVVWHFAAQCALNPKRDFVPGFVAKHYVEPKSENLFVTVDYLKVSQPIEYRGMRFIPVASEELPTHPKIPPLNLDPPVGSVVRIEIKGTDRIKMADRGRDRVRDGLRLLRVGLAEHMAIGNRQLRFRVGQSHSFGADHFGRRRPDDAAYELEFDTRLLDLVGKVEVAGLSNVPATDIERRAHRATRWLERAWFVGEPLDALLFMFFALEALLGDASEGLKGPALAFRTALLSHLAIGGFTNPNETFFLYDVVRSGAVHGEDVPEITWNLAESFGLTVRWALSHYLKFARERGFTKRSQLLVAINSNPARDELIRWLRSYGGTHWLEYLDRLV